MLFGMRKNYLGVGMVMGMVAGAAAVAAAVLSCPTGKCMARRAIRRSRRVMQHMRSNLG